jgi:4Fe-4S ferredoxin
VIGSVGAVARGLIDRDFIEKRAEACVFCGICAKVCPTGALAVRKAEKEGAKEGAKGAKEAKEGPMDEVEGESYLSRAIGPTTVDDRCVHCGLCAEVCPGGSPKTGASESRVRPSSTRRPASTAAAARRSVPRTPSP